MLWKFDALLLFCSPSPFTLQYGIISPPVYWQYFLAFNHSCCSVAHLLFHAHIINEYIKQIISKISHFGILKTYLKTPIFAQPTVLWPAPSPTSVFLINFSFFNIFSLVISLIGIPSTFWTPDRASLQHFFTFKRNYLKKQRHS